MRIIVLLMIVGLAALQSAGIAAPTTGPAADIDLPSFGIAAPIPAGWRRASEPDEVIAVRWEKVDRSNKPEAIIDLQLWPRRAAPSARALAEKEAKRLGGRVNREAVELGGAEAFEFVIVVKTGADAKSVDVARTRIVKHAGNYYALAERSTGESTHQAFEQIAKALKLSDPAPPSESIRSRKESAPLMAVQLVMQLPDPYRCINDSGKRQDYNILNLATGGTEVEMTVAPTTTLGPDFNATLETMGRSLARHYGWSNPPAWHRVNGKVSVAYTDLMPAGKDERGQPTHPIQLMVVANNTAAQIVTIQYPCPAPAAEKYAARLDEIAKSVRADPAYFAARRAAEAAEQGK
ncbi:MAG: hypothetical protein H7Z14_05285 [Anaerolineae bacterium]|nr:hypothetical protein [Phycisphaerae bacterium]